MDVKVNVCVYVNDEQGSLLMMKIDQSVGFAYVNQAGIYQINMTRIW